MEAVIYRCLCKGAKKENKKKKERIIPLKCISIQLFFFFFLQANTNVGYFKGTLHSTKVRLKSIIASNKKDGIYPEVFTNKKNKNTVVQVNSLNKKRCLEVTQNHT